MRHLVIAAFVHVSASPLYRFNGDGEPVAVPRKTEVTPPCEVEFTDELQLERLITAGCVHPRPIDGLEGGDTQNAKNAVTGDENKPVLHGAETGGGSDDKSTGAETGGGSDDKSTGDDTGGGSDDKSTGDDTGGASPAADAEQNGGDSGNGSKPDAASGGGSRRGRKPKPAPAGDTGG